MKRPTTLESLSLQRTLYLTSKTVDENDVTQLQTIFTNNTITTELNFSFHSLKPTVENSFIELLCNNTTLTSLKLSCPTQSRSAALYFAKILSYNTTLVNADASGNGIDPEGALSLGKALQRNTTLTSLNLSNNHLWSEGVSNILTMFDKNTTLRSLNIDNNYLYEQALHALYKFAVFRPSLCLTTSYYEPLVRHNEAWYLAKARFEGKDELNTSDLSRCYLSGLPVTFAISCNRNNEISELLCCAVNLPTEVIERICLQLFTITYSDYAHKAISTIPQQN